MDNTSEENQEIQDEHFEDVEFLELQKHHIKTALGALEKGAANMTKEDQVECALSLLFLERLDMQPEKTHETEEDIPEVVPIKTTGKLLEPEFYQWRFFNCLQKFARGDVLSTVVHKVAPGEYVLRVLNKKGCLQKIDVFGFLAYLSRSRENEIWLGEPLKEKELVRVVVSRGDLEVGKIYVEMNEKLCRSPIKLGRIEAGDLPCYVDIENNSQTCPRKEDLLLKMKVDPNISVRFARRFGIDPYKLTYEKETKNNNEQPSLTTNEPNSEAVAAASDAVTEKPAELIEKALASAKLFYLKGKYEEARQCVLQVLKLDKKNDDATKFLTFANKLHPEVASFQDQPLEVLEATRQSLAAALQET